MRILILIITAVFVNCAVSSQQINLVLDQSEKIIDGHVVNDRINIAKYDYSDSVVNLIVTPMQSSVSVVVENKTMKDIKVLWDECSIVDISNRSVEVTVGSSLIIDRTRTAVPSVVSPKSFGENTLTPTDKIYYHRATSTWRVENLISNDDPKRLIGKKLKIYIPILVENVKQKYLITYKVVG